MAKILIVDDDKFTRTVLETIFRQDKLFADLSLEILTAPDGQKGLEAFQRHKPDAVVLDLLMPRLDGFGLCKGIRALPEGDGAHLAVMSGVYRDNAIATRLSQEYDAHFFAKPYQLKDMTRFVAELLASGKRRASAEPSPIVETAPTTGNELATQVSAGELSERALPAVLLDLLEAEATGRLVVRRGKVSKTIELLLGHPVAVTSTLRDETLGQLLVGKGAITEAQHRAALARASAENTRVGEAMIDLGILTPEQLAMHLTGQLRHKLVTALRWPIGVWRFEPERDVGGARPGGTIDGLATVIGGLRETADLANPPPHVRQAFHLPLYLKQRGHRLLEMLERQVAPKLGQLWRDGANVDELVGYGLERPAVITVVDILLMVDGAEVERDEERSQPGVEFDSGSQMSVSELSEHSQMARLSKLAEQEQRAGELYDSLFDDGSTMAPLPSGADPLEVTETDDGVPHVVDEVESGIIDVASMSTGEDTPDAASRELLRARRMLLHEYLRIQGLDHYGVLMVERDVSEATLSAAVVERQSKFSLDWYARFDLGRDYAKLEQLHAAYNKAFEVLIDPASRAAYDGGEPAPEEGAGDRAPPLEAEIGFGVAQEKLAAGEYDDAIARLGDAIATAPEDATYIATLGWAHYLRGNRTARAADEARRHLNEALAKNPDSPTAHAFKGVIGVELGDDDEDARFHLEQALDADPSHGEALEALETLWRRAGEFRPLEKAYRRLIYRAAGRDPVMELTLWRKLAELYRAELNDPESARVAYESASRLSPGDAGLQAALADLDSGAPDRFFERAEVLRSHWRRDPNVAGPGVELMRAAEQAARPDASFMTASALVARGLATPEAEQMYQRYRPRFLIRAQRLLDAEIIDRVRHPDDRPDIGALFELMAPAVAAAMPLGLDDLEVDDSSRIDEDLLPPGFVRVRAYVAHMLGVAPPAVYLRPDFGRQIHVGAVDPPVLLAGDDAVAAPERSELGFRLGRAMTYLFAGRAVGGSRPSRFLKAAVLAAWKIATPNPPAADDPEGYIPALEAQLRALPAEHLRRICAAVADITGRHRALNLSRWSRGLARTADRVGLLLCGDLPAAVRFAADVSGSAGTADLVDFAISSNHLALRASLGLSIDV